MLGLPDGVAACLFDMDGVVTQTAWCTRRRGRKCSTSSSAPVPRALEPSLSRLIRTPTTAPTSTASPDWTEPGPSCSPGASTCPRHAERPARLATVYGLSNRKNDLVLVKLAQDGVQVYQGTISYIHAVRDKE